MLWRIKYSFCILLKLVINGRKMLIRGKISGRRDLFHVYKKKESSMSASLLSWETLQDGLINFKRNIKRELKKDCL